MGGRSSIGGALRISGERSTPDRGSEIESPKERELVAGHVDYRGQYIFEADEGFRVVFRPASRIFTWIGFYLVAGLVVAGTLRLLLAEPEFNPLAWGIAATADFALILALNIIRKNVAKGPLSVDGAERRILFYGGREVAFKRLRELRIVRSGDRAELVIVHEEGSLHLGKRPIPETERAAAAVARITELELVEAGGSL